MGDKGSEAGAVDSKQLASFKGDYDKNAKNALAEDVLAVKKLKEVAVNRNTAAKSLHKFSLKVPEAPATNQRSSGRCWIFAALNVIRDKMIREKKLGKFELSQSYVFFWDKFEKANYFLEQVIDLLDEKVEGRILSFLLDAPVSDGGQYDMFVNIVNKYGLVPKDVYPDSTSATASRPMNWLLRAKLREFAKELRALKAKGSSVDAVRDRKREQLSEIYRILCINLGSPPTTFDWVYVDDDKKLTRVKGLTPVTFAREQVGFDVNRQVSLINDPRNPYYKLYTVERLGNVVGGKPVRYINVPIEVLKEYAIKTLQAKEPVWFGCDVGKFYNAENGVLDLDYYSYDKMFDVNFSGFTKAERLVYGESQMTHAMVFTGVDIEDGKSLAWRVQNSHGDKRGDKGYIRMSDRWFDEYMFQISVDEGTLPAKILDIRNTEPVALPPWDPMGSLAGGRGFAGQKSSL